MELKVSSSVCIAVRDYYDKPAFYRYMTPSIFDVLERSYIDGMSTAEVPESDFIRMITEIELHNGCKNN